MITEETSVADLLQAGEPIAAGYFEMPDAPPIRRMARGLRRHFELSPLPEWLGDPLYPSGLASLPEPPSAIRISYTSSLVIDHGSLDAKIRRYEGTPAGDALRRTKVELSDLYVVGSSIPPELCLGGGGIHP